MVRFAKIWLKGLLSPFLLLMACMPWVSIRSKEKDRLIEELYGYAIEVPAFTVQITLRRAGL
jgi:hypothetical protein